MKLQGDLVVPPDATGLVLFAHGSGSGRFSPRNRHVAAMLQDAGLATFLIDLLTQEEEDEDRQTAALRFDIAFLGERLLEVIDQLHADPEAARLPLGCFGSSTGAAAALMAAALRPDHVSAVVSRGGRPDLAVSYLDRVSVPTLLLVGGEDREVLALNRRALQLLHGEKELAVIPGATHLFEEEGALDRVADLAARWFRKHLQPRQSWAHPDFS